LAVNTAARSPLRPQVPSITEAGSAHAAYDFGVGMFVTAKTPKAIVDKLHAAVLSALARPELKERLASDGHYRTQERLITRIVLACADHLEVKSLEICLRKFPVHNGSGWLGVGLSVDATALAGMRSQGHVA
jgi:hypothetical protein